MYIILSILNSALYISMLLYTHAYLPIKPSNLQHIILFELCQHGTFGTLHLCHVKAKASQAFQLPGRQRTAGARRRLVLLTGRIIYNIQGGFVGCTWVICVCRYVCVYINIFVWFCMYIQSYEIQLNIYLNHLYHSWASKKRRRMTGETRRFLKDCWK